MAGCLMGETHRLTADVAVIGGGTAGLNAAMAAAESGASVLVVDKAHIMRSGAIAGGIDHFFAYLEHRTGVGYSRRLSGMGRRGAPRRLECAHPREGLLR